MSHPVILTLLVITFIADIYILIYAITRKDVSRSAYLVFLTLSVTFYVLGSLLYGMIKTYDGAMTALRVLSMGTVMLAPAMLLLILCLYQPKMLKPWMLYAAASYVILAFFVVFFNNSHKLYYSSIEYIEANNWSYMEIKRGAVYWVMQGVTLLCMIPTLAIMLARFIKGSRKIRAQMNYVIAGTMAVLVANALNFTNMLPKNIDVMPFVLTFTLVLFTLDMAKNSLWGIVTFASSTALETMEDAVIVLNDVWGFLYCNNSAKSMFPFLDSFPVTDTVSLAADWPAEFESVRQSGEIIFEREKQGAKHTYRVNTKKIMNEGGVQIGWYIILHDITDVTFLINQLESLATTDSLTGVANRRHFLDRVPRELDRSSPTRLNLPNAMIMYDLDDFKKVNDTYGHAAGDYILCAVVETIKQQLRSYDIIARYGGEEFVIFTPSPDEHSLYKFAHRLCKAIESSEFVYEGTVIPMTASFGAVQINPGDDFNEAMLAVDEAMYKAKNNGKNQVVIGSIHKTGEELNAEQII
jgi:diguanylate cyclase (GGDEF)-like protein